MSHEGVAVGDLPAVAINHVERGNRPVRRDVENFFEPVGRNEPYLSSALRVIGGLVSWLGARNMPAEKVVVLGFSQWASFITTIKSFILGPVVGHYR